jgi:hypothetical protein
MQNAPVLEHRLDLLPLRPMLWLLWAVLTTIGGVTGDVLSPWIKWDFFSLPFFLSDFFSLPFSLVVLVQWLILARFVPRAHWWLLTSLLGVLYVGVLKAVSFVGEGAYFPPVRSLAFWDAALWVGSVTFLLGGVVGLVQCFLVIRRSGASIKQCFRWVLTSAIAWGVGFPLRMLAVSIFWNTSGLAAGLPLGLLTVAVHWGAIGILTGASLSWARELSS